MIADEIKPEYAAALQRVTVEGQSVKDFAAGVQACCGACADAGCTECTGVFA